MLKMCLPAIINSFFYEMDIEDLELVVTAIILLQRVRKRRFKRKSRKQWVCAIFKVREEKDAYYQLVRENVYHTNIGIFYNFC